MKETGVFIALVGSFCSLLSKKKCVEPPGTIGNHDLDFGRSRVMQSERFS